MIRGTKQKQTRRAPRQRKASSARRTLGSRRTSRREPAHRTAHPARAKAVRKKAPEPVKKLHDADRAAALKNFGSAVKYFQRRDYEKAAALFEKVAAGPVREMADRARIHLRYCNRKRHHEKRPRTAEVCYARGVAALNRHEYEQALEYLNKSDKMTPNQEYVHYALAAAYGLQGDPDNAFDHLEAAIRLRPQNRVQARHDEDFQVLAGDPRFTRLLGADVPRRTPVG
jgi:tetratricopeptide (TPR) repeat protein